MSTPTFTKSGNKASVAKTLPKDVFALEVKNHELVKQAYVTYLANGRQNLAKTKKRGEVRGGGKKPWRQKGTGRARFGSSRNPIWRGGGIAFGPTGLENYSKDMNVAAKRLALRQALSLKNGAGAVAVIEEVAFKEPKTSAAADLIKKTGLTGNVLLVLDAPDKNVTQATNNIPTLAVTRSGLLNVYDVMNADAVLFTETSLQKLTERLTPKPATKVEA